MKLAVFIALAFVSACSSQANHVGNPLTLPVRGVAVGLENVNYDAKRNKLKAYVIANRSEIISEIKNGSGTHLDQAMKLANIKRKKRSELTRELRSDPNLYFGPEVEPMVVAFMVHGDN